MKEITIRITGDDASDYLRRMTAEQPGVFRTFEQVAEMLGEDGIGYVLTMKRKGAVGPENKQSLEQMELKEPSPRLAARLKASGLFDSDPPQHGQSLNADGDRFAAWHLTDR